MNTPEKGNIPSMHNDYFMSKTVPALALFFVLLSAEAPLTLEALYRDGDFKPVTFKIAQWIDGGAAYLTIDQSGSLQRVIRHNVSTGEQRVYFSLDSLREQSGRFEGKWTELAVSADGRWMLIGIGTRKKWRRSTLASYFLFNRHTGSLAPLTRSGDVQQVPKFSSDSQQIAFIRNNDLHVRNLQTGRVRQLTRDGSSTVYNGHGDWLYEEEFRLTGAFKWSPDGRHIAFLKFELPPESAGSNTYPLVNELVQYPTVDFLPYPKVGAKNPRASVGIVDIRRGKIKWAYRAVGDEYIPRIYWTGRPNEIAFLRLGRPQHNLDLMVADIKSGKTRILVQQSDPAWVRITDDLHFFDGGQQLLWTSEASGYRHIQRYDRSSSQTFAVTSGDWEVTEIIGFDAAAGAIYYTGKQDGVHEQQAYRIRVNGGKQEKLTTAPGWYDLEFAPDYSAWLQRWQSFQHPEKVSLHRSNGAFIRWLVEDPLPGLQAINLPRVTFFDLPTPTGETLPARLIQPHDFDPNQTYPTLIYTYGGPASQAAVNKWRKKRTLWHMYLAQEGFVIFTVDNHGTGGRGKQFAALAYEDAGAWPVQDNIAAAHWIGEQTWGDRDRIGIWGWSFGGYTTAMCLSRSDLFAAGVAVSPVTDLRLYDTAWTERYMGLVTENESGYEAANVINYVSGYQKGLLLIHGTGDDNVHAQHSWQYIDALVREGKQFELMMYPGLNHGLPGAEYHLYSLMTRFLKENLGMEE